MFHMICECDKLDTQRVKFDIMQNLEHKPTEESYIGMLFKRNNVKHYFNIYNFIIESSMLAIK